MIILRIDVEGFEYDLLDRALNKSASMLNKASADLEQTHADVLKSLPICVVGTLVLELHYKGPYLRSKFRRRH